MTLLNAHTNAPIWGIIDCVLTKLNLRPELGLIKIPWQGKARQGKAKQIRDSWNLALLIILGSSILALTDPSEMKASGEIHARFLSLFKSWSRFQTSIILQSPKSGLQRHHSSLHLKNQNSKPKFGRLMFQKPVTISNSRSRFQTLIRNLQHPWKPYIRT